MAEPFFSVITVCFNASNNIENCLFSLYRQTFRNFEHIIQDGYSTDKTISKIQNLKDERSLIKSEKDEGIYDGLNKGIRRCSGQYILILHSDDILHNKNILKKLFKFIKTNQFPKVILSGIEFFNRNGNITRRWISSLPTKKNLKNGWMAPHTGIVLRSDVIKEIGSYDTSFKISSDYNYEIKLFKIYMSETVIFNSILTKMKTGGISNAGLTSKINKTFEDFIIMKRNGFNPFLGIILKNIRKLNQLSFINPLSYLSAYLFQKK